MRKYFILLCTVVAFSGCGLVQMYKYDPLTVNQIDKTIQYENQDFDMADKALAELNAPDIVRTSLKVRHESEIVRLNAWKDAEAAKKVDDSGIATQPRGI